MARTSDLMRRLGMTTPIIQAPMAGGGDTPALAASVGEAGGLGTLGVAYRSPEQIREAGRDVQARSDRSFGINLFAPQPPAEMPAGAVAALDRVAPFYAELGLPRPERPNGDGFDFSEQLEAALESGATLFSFTLGLLPPEAVSAIKQRGMVLAGTATTVAEAVALERSGCDAVIAQGCEAGGHRGSFDDAPEAGLLGVMALVPQVVDAVSLPVIAAGGIMDGRGIAAALALGASAVQMGTAFLVCEEAGIGPAYREALLRAGGDDTRLTRAFSGRTARGIANRFVVEMAPAAAAGEILPFPLQNALTRRMRTAAAKQGKADYLSLWAGQAVGLTRPLPAAALVARLMEETQAAIEDLAQ